MSNGTNAGKGAVTGALTARVAEAPAQAFGAIRDWIGGWRKRGVIRNARMVLTATDSHDNFREMAFTFAVIALAAKLAAADGEPKNDEFIAFREAFPMPSSEHEKIRRLFSLAVRDGVQAVDHARRIALLFPPSSHQRLLNDVLARLLRVATADGPIRRAEEAVLREIARCFNIGRRAFSKLLHSHLEQTGAIVNPYAVLGVRAEWADAEIRKAYHRLMREYHPDSVLARGGSAEAVLVASRQVAKLNAAYNAIRAERRP